MSAQTIAELKDATTLRAGINLSNPLLVTGRTPSGDPVGVAPDMAKALADRLGVRLKLVSFPAAHNVADAVADDAWDVGFIGAEPQRAATITFSDPYVGIESTYLVPEGSPIRSIAEVDRPGVRIAVSAGSAYDLFLDRSIKQATLIRKKSGKAAEEAFVNDKLEVLAGLRPALMELKTPGRILTGNFTMVLQAIGAKPRNKALAAFAQDFVTEAKKSGLVARLIARHGVEGKLSVP